MVNQLSVGQDTNSWGHENLDAFLVGLLDSSTDSLQRQGSIVSCL